MYNKFSQQKYIYLGEKPEMNLGDSSLENEMNESGEENVNESIKISEKDFQIRKCNEIPPIHIPSIAINNQGIYFCSITKDTEGGFIRLNSNNKEDNFCIKKKLNFDKENNRYDNKDSDNNEISIKIIGDIFNQDDYNSKKDKQNEIILDSKNRKVIENKENNENNNNTNLNKINNETISEIKNGNLDKRNEINENIEKIIQKINKNKRELNINNKQINIKDMNKDNNETIYSIDNKENIFSNKKYSIEAKKDYNMVNKKEGIIKINKSNFNDSSLALNNEFFESKNRQKNNENNLSKSKRNLNISLKRKRIGKILNLTKKYKIFHKFLCVSLDTSGLYSLDDEINSLLLNPKITFNYPNNNLEKELD